MIKIYFKKWFIFSQSYDENLPSSIFSNSFNTVIFEPIYLFRIYYENLERFSRKIE